MKNVVVIEELKNFDLKQTLECGQIFRYERISSNSYRVITKNKRTRLTQKPGSTTLMIHDSNISEYEEIWKDYLDMETDYEHIINQVSKDDPYMQKALEYGQGIRILKQDTWETLISFIISQNKAIPHIQQCINNLCQAFGQMVMDKDGESYYAFPTVEELSKATEQEIRDCKVGFRAPYIMDACQKIMDNTVVLEALPAMSTQEAKEVLMKIKGVGEKVAHCVLLFGLGKTDTFPTDVWIKRIMESIYFDHKETSNQHIIEFANKKYGDYAGYAQQYLFYYGRQTAQLDRKAKKD